ncbi:3-hydroxyisobutyrate dehydrogenase [Paractinoplanes atraurantiacus]|uniref:3-hydroxyisobutyrate dehydrogenase n=1 Tax=Paractinoplanes atraurantiacus TaxID=1036182 RepID=A0A285J946_9ACTN|nr:NAD(P)-dependent oxidoreductase [Actinoplanes atraurantiacus]SNY56840.1 3-hydroxyisobutyrate dehydrogenase [Actinoplanes atraurantiacus]
MPTVAIVSAGFMGSGLGAALLTGGARVVTTLEGRSERSRRLAESAGLEILPTLADALAAADVVLSVTPPAAAVDAARSIAATGGGRRPGLVVADLNAVSPGTMGRVARELDGVRVVDGSISGPPPSVKPGARIYLSGPDAAIIAGLPWAGMVEPVVLGDRVGAASALKMCTGSVYKGLMGLLTQAMRTAGAHGVLDAVVDDLARNGLADSDGVARAATKAHRYVDEMREVSATQAEAGLSPDLFAAMAAVFADVASTRLADDDPENDRDLTPAEIVARLQKRE